MMFFDRHGHPVSRAIWQNLATKAGYVTVTEDAVSAHDGALLDVQTFWIGVGDRHNRLIFCTVVTSARRKPLTWGWQTEAQAKAGHEAICAWLAGKGNPPPAGLRRP